MAGRCDDGSYWLRTAYQLFSEEGYPGLTFSKLIFRSGLSPQSFYYFFQERSQLLECLFREHQKRVNCLLPKLHACFSFIPDVLHLVTEHPTEVRFHRRLLLGKNEDAGKKLYRELNASLNPVIYPIWAEYMGYTDSPKSGKKIHLLLMDLWLLHLDPTDLSYEALIENTTRINRWLQFLRNGRAIFDISV